MARIRLGNLKGPKGDRGEAGPRGPQGIQGPPGTAENIDLTPFVKKTENTTLTGQYTFTNNTPIKLNGYDVVSENNRVLFKNASNNNVFAFDGDTITHNDKSLLTQDKANTLYAPIGDYALRSSLADYASRQYVTYAVKNFITSATADSTYAKKTDLNNYATSASLSNYLTTANAGTTYLSKTDAASTYAKKTDLSGYAPNSSLSNYVTTATANSTYLNKTDASSTYLSKSDADTTYAKKTDVVNGLTLTRANDAYVSKTGTNNVTGTINISQTAGLTLANHILESNPTNLVIKNKANQPILTVYPSVAYLNGREVLNQFKADQLYASKTALNDYVTTTNANSTYLSKTDASNTYATKANLNSYVTTSQYNNDMNSLLTALRNVNN
nr:MAG TPA: Pulmonary surfactant-associated protein D, c-type lectin, alpha-helical coiled [Caudoviricetes sp.]